jgi:hypothetical protein
MSHPEQSAPLVCLACPGDPRGDSSQSTYVWLTGQASGSVPVRESRIQAHDLRDAQLQSSRLRAGRSAAADPLFLDLEVLVDISAAAAQRALSQVASPRRQSTHYVGTVSGLRGLIRDIHALRIADGVVLFPISSRTAEILQEHAALIS